MASQLNGLPPWIAEQQRPPETMLNGVILYVAVTGYRVSSTTTFGLTVT
ncbi:MAG: hypothetical protein JOZ31_21335 [Verrucomicrobia bacterium]|nr:hypothetical protein [Verrucomicrobiota bacterium]